MIPEDESCDFGDLLTMRLTFVVVFEIPGQLLEALPWNFGFDVGLSTISIKHDH